MEYLPNKLTPLYSEIHYEEENYLKVRTVVFKYITPPYSKGSVRQYVGTSVRRYVGTSRVPTFSRFYALSSVMWLGYPSSHDSTGSISPASCALTDNSLRSLLTCCTILQVTQTASGLPKKSLEERKVENSKSFTLHVCTVAACLQSSGASHLYTSTSVWLQHASKALELHAFTSKLELLYLGFAWRA